jgi:putative phosphonate metabolism protein
MDLARLVAVPPCAAGYASSPRFERQLPRTSLRYALYATPSADHPLTLAAARWLGRDAFTGADHPLPQIDGFQGGTIEAYLADPARYGFHGTLKAPFSLAETADEAGLIASLDAFAASADAITVPELVVRRLGRFFALVPNERVAALDELASRIVVEFEPFRAPLAEADIARRRAAGLTLDEETNLLRWGYPYVFDAFRYHMSLTGRVPKEDAAAMEAALRTFFAEFDGKPFVLDQLALFVEPERGAPFAVRHVAPLRGRAG